MKTKIISTYANSTRRVNITHKQIGSHPTTKFTAKADIKAKPGLRRRILLKIERDKRAKTKHKGPVIYGKGWASDRAGKTMQIPAMTFKARKQMKKEMAVAAEKGYKRIRFKKFGYKKGSYV